MKEPFQHPKIIQRYLDWAFAKKVAWYEFWDARSGLLGGLIFASIIILCGTIIWRLALVVMHLV